MKGGGGGQADSSKPLNGLGSSEEKKPKELQYDEYSEAREGPQESEGVSHPRRAVVSLYLLPSPPSAGVWRRPPLG